MTSLTVPPPSLANQAAAVGRSSEIDPTLGSLSLVGTLQPPQPILRAFCPSIRGTSLGPGPAGKLGMLAALWPPCQLGIQNPLRNWPLQSAYGGWSPDCKGKCNPERTGVLCESRARQPPTQNNCPGWIQVSLAPSSSSLETPASPQKAMEARVRGRFLLFSVGDSGTPRLSPPDHPALPDRLLQSALFTHCPAEEVSLQQSLQLGSSTVSLTPNPTLSSLPRGPRGPRGSQTLLQS